MTSDGTVINVTTTIGGTVTTMVPMLAPVVTTTATIVALSTAGDGTGALTTVVVILSTCAGADGLSTLGICATHGVPTVQVVHTRNVLDVTLAFTSEYLVDKLAPATVQEPVQLAVLIFLVKLCVLPATTRVINAWEPSQTAPHALHRITETIGPTGVISQEIIALMEPVRQEARLLQVGHEFASSVIQCAQPAAYPTMLLGVRCAPTRIFFGSRVNTHVALPAGTDQMHLGYTVSLKEAPTNACSAIVLAEAVTPLQLTVSLAWLEVIW